MKAKRIISSLVACAMVASTIAAMSANVNAASTDELTATVSTATAAAGSTFSVDVSLANVPTTGIQAVEFAIKYDPSVVTIDSVKEGVIATSTGAAEAEVGLAPDLAGSNVNGGDYSCLDYNIAADTGTVSVMWVTAMTESSYWIKDDGVFLTLSGTLSADATGTAGIEIVPIERDTYPNSGVSNSSVIFGYIDEATANCITYDCTTVKGGVTVTSDTAVTTGTSETTTTEATTTIGGDVLLGDINQDGKVGTADLVLLAKFFVGTVEFTDIQLKAADVTQDGAVKTSDLVRMAQMLVA